MQVQKNGDYKYKAYSTISTVDLPTNIQMHEKHEKLKMGKKTAQWLMSASSQEQILEGKKDV